MSGDTIILGMNAHYVVMYTLLGAVLGPPRIVHHRCRQLVIDDTQHRPRLDRRYDLHPARKMRAADRQSAVR